MIKINTTKVNAKVNIKRKYNGSKQDKGKHEKDEQDKDKHNKGKQKDSGVTITITRLQSSTELLKYDTLGLE